jgi:multidrug efflux system membrane fusion protein
VRTTVLTLVAALALAGCAQKKPIAQPPQGVQAQTISLQKGDPAGLRFSAVVMPDMEVPLAFRVPGYVVSLKQVRGQDGRLRDLAEGDHISRGSVLVQIRTSEYQDKVKQSTSQIEAAEAAALKAKLDWERATRLYDAQSITKPEYDSAKAQFDATQAEVRAARAQTNEAEVALRDTSLVMPFNGDIVKKSVDLGAFVGPGTPVLAVANTDIVKITVGVPDITVRSVKLGRPVNVTVDAFPDRIFAAHISRISSAADATTKNFDVEVAIANREHLLKAGMIGSLQLEKVTLADKTPTLTVPISAIVQAPGGKYGVYLLAQGNRGEVARLRTVETGAVVDTDITIISGLTPGERIITTGANLLKEGQRVEVLQ